MISDHDLEPTTLHNFRIVNVYNPYLRCKANNIYHYDEYKS